MKNLKKFVATVTVVGILGAAGTAFAATAMTPAEILSGLTGKPVSELYQERSEGKTFGTIANESGKLEEFKSQNLEQKKAVLDQRVKDGKLDQEQADQVYNSIKNNQTTCDGTGNARLGRKQGAGFGQGCGMALGQGAGAGMGSGKGMNR